jgi:3-deoxy-D-manno-octulosonate 8-phosphate phosphatase (KDO 8-P phosphatase)
MIIFTDVDGVLTDGKVMYPGRYRFFNVRDGHGVQLAHERGWDVVFLTGENDESSRARARRLNVPFQWASNKLGAAKQYFWQDGDRTETIAYIGDDTIDMELLSWAQIAACPQNAHADVIDLIKRKQEQDIKSAYLVPANGGEGAFRIFIEWMIDQYCE